MATTKPNKTTQFPILAQALCKESWEYLLDYAPEIADALTAEMKPGVKPDEIRRFVTRFTGREEIARRLEQAAEYLASGNIE